MFCTFFVSTVRLRKLSLRLDNKDVVLFYKWMKFLLTVLIKFLGKSFFFVIRCFQINVKLCSYLLTSQNNGRIGTSSRQSWMMFGKQILSGLRVGHMELYLMEPRVDCSTLRSLAICRIFFVNSERETKKWEIMSN